MKYLRSSSILVSLFTISYASAQSEHGVIHMTFPNIEGSYTANIKNEYTLGKKGMASKVIVKEFSCPGCPKELSDSLRQLSVKRFDEPIPLTKEQIKQMKGSKVLSPLIYHINKK